MTYQSQLIDAIKARLYISSDYGIAQRWRTEPTRISQYRRDRLRLPLNYILDIADQTGIDPIIILKKLETERALKKQRQKGKNNDNNIINWRPNNQVKKYVPDWVKRRNYHQKLAND